ncbi:hypothetical protein ENKNEFLB_02008 [Nocardioides aquaticus]|uniref:HNH nuclease domain-containing protein n=1 Tax=Nocardioides aquaticus TaxID=160826 RepID=A0ABX8EIA4_9ACTN|nr:HNH endonuclease signature motif containing protein [Nocardioides aquaticus]QVT79625.1 hypothetical protein ENKNEFLB_02008 [Nocardioides aquaticus]
MPLSPAPDQRAATAVTAREERVTGEVTTPADLLARVREAHDAEERAGVDLLVLAVAWADAHPADADGPMSRWWVPVRAGARAADDDGGLDLEGLEAAAAGGVDLDEVNGGEGVDPEWFGIPPVRWDAPASFAAARRMTTTSGKALIRDALVLEHRLPRTWARVLQGGVPAWRARRVAQAVLGAPPDVVAYVDDRVHRVIATVGHRRLDALLDEAMLELHPEEREMEQLDALDARHATLHRSGINHTGIVEMTLRGDWADLDDFDAVLSVVAAALQAADEASGSPDAHDSLDVRRARAVGVLADPARALALLQPGTGPAAAPGGAAPVPPPRREVVGYLHLTPEHLAGLEMFVRDGTTLRQVIESQVRAWCGRTDTYLRVTPVVDLNDDPDDHATPVYSPGEGLRERVLLRHPTCVFPWCERPSRGLQLDHVVAYEHPDPPPDDRPGEPDPPSRADPDDQPQTSETNLAPLCGHHHQLKTHGGWSYSAIDPTGPRPVFLWRSPHGEQFVRTPDGTTHLAG